MGKHAVLNFNPFELEVLQLSDFNAAPKTKRLQNLHELVTIAPCLVFLLSQPVGVLQQPLIQQYKVPQNQVHGSPGSNYQQTTVAQSPSG